jgi:hypothetical protein
LPLIHLLIQSQLFYSLPSCFYRTHWLSTHLRVGFQSLLSFLQLSPPQHMYFFSAMLATYSTHRTLLHWSPQQYNLQVQILNIILQFFFVLQLLTTFLA